MELEECCRGLESSKVTERAKSIKQISFLLQKSRILKSIKDGNTSSWDNIIFSTYFCLMKDADKYVEDMKKKNTSTVAHELNAKTFFDIIDLAIKENCNLNCSKILDYVKSFIERKTMKELYGRSCLATLKENILSNSDFRSRLESSDWLDLLKTLKNICESAEILKGNSYVQVECVALIIKWGPIYSLSPDDLREEFTFVTEICKSVRQSSLRPHKEVILQLAIEFCKHTAKDNRLACCKLGEELMSYFMELYEINVREDNLKLQLLEFFLLQVVIHHPRGAPESHPTSHACDWPRWKSYLRSIYRLLCDEIDFNMKCRNKNAILFFMNEDGRQELKETYLNLFVEIGKQVLNKTYTDVSMASNYHTVPDTSSSKRLKLEISIATLITNIKQTKNWPLIQVTYSLLNVYPDIIFEEDYVRLLGTMENLQKACSDQDLRFHIYKCLIVLKEMWMSNDTFKSCDSSSVWKSIAETTFKEASLHLSNTVTERLLQLFSANQQLHLSQPIMKVFLSSNIYNEGRIESLYLYGQNYDFPRSDNNLVKREFIEHILSIENSKIVDYFAFNLTAKLLTNLVFKQWLSQEVVPKCNLFLSKRPHKDITDIYFKTEFEDVLIVKQTSDKLHQTLKTPVVDVEIEQFLMHTLNRLVNNITENHNNNLELILNTAILIKNIVSEFSSCGVAETDIDALLTSLESLLDNFTKTLSDLSSCEDELSVKKITKNLELLYTYLIETNDSFTLAKTISSISQDLMKVLFDILNKNAKRNYSSPKNIKFLLTFQAMKVISTYSFISSDKERTQTQCFAFDAIVNCDYDVKDECDYLLTKAFLSAFSISKPGSLDEDSLKSLLNFTKRICSARYTYYESALEILETFKLILIYVRQVYLESIVSYVVRLLEPFYNRRNRYGPKVSVLLIECLDLLCQIDSEHNLYQNWIGNNLVITVLSEFLCSNYQEVRFATVSSIARFFSYNTNAARRIQHETFKKVFQYSLQVFEAGSTDSNDDRKVDETVTRTSSVLQTFASLALANPLWVQESLFSTLRIANIKKLISLEKVVSLLATHFGMKNKSDLLECNLEYILNRWKNFNLNLDAFPFYLLDCGDKKDFCAKYVRNIMQFLIDDDQLLTLACQVSKKEKKVLLQEHAVKILAHCVTVDGTDKLTSMATSNKKLSKSIGYLGNDAFKQAIKSDVTILIYELLYAVTDEEHFEKKLRIQPMFPIFYGNSLTVHQFEVFLRYLETDIYHVDSLIVHLMHNEPYKLHKLILALKLELDKNKFTKAKTFCSYFIIISLLSEQLSDTFPHYEYFIRDTVMYLLNLMEDHTKLGEVSILASQALSTFIGKILPKFSEDVSPFFHILVNKLSNLALYFKDLKDICINILKVLVIENKDIFSSNISTLDPFPSSTEFVVLRTLHLEIRYSNETSTLQKDIEYFLQCGYQTKFSDLREEGLKYLLNQLTTKKEELCKLYSQGKNNQSVPQDKGNILQQLVIMLIKLTQSKKSNVAIEASRCLGELGVMDFNTLILEHEKVTQLPHLSPLEIFCGHCISHLQLYIVSQNVNLVAAATEGLYHSLMSKEGRKVSKCEDEFVHGKINWNYVSPFVAPKVKTDCQIRIDERLISDLYEDSIWCPDHNVSHNDWIVKVVSSLLKIFTDKCFLPKLVSVCEQKVEFCESMLPYLLYLILTMTKKPVNDVLFAQVGCFFQQHWDKSIENVTEESITLNQTSLKCMLNCVYYLRLQIISSANLKSPKSSINMSLDYLHLAQAAYYSKQHFMAILYIEIWCQKKFYNIIDSLPKNQQGKYLTSKLRDVVYENIDPQISQVLEDILRSSYKMLGEFDALHGCGTSLFLDPSRRIEHYKDLGCWNQALLYHEVSMSNNPSNIASKKELVNSLKHCSLYKVPMLCSGTDEIDYECLWRLGQWDIDNIKAMKDMSNDEFEKHRYFALKCLNENDCRNLEMTINNARANEICYIKHSSLENCRSIYTVLAKLQSLREIENFIDASSSDTMDQLKKAWDLQDKFMNAHFDYIEPIKEQRIVMLRSKLRTLENLDALVDTSLNLAEYARLENHLSIATRCLNNLRFCDNLTNAASSRIQFEDAQLCWALNDQTSAHHILRHLYGDQQTDPRIRSCALKLAGKWFIESLSENKHVIISNYLLSSLNVYKDLQRNSEDINNIYDTYDVLAQFADKEYQQIMSHMNSDAFQQKVKNMEKLKEAGKKFKAIHGERRLTYDENKALRIYERQSAIDENEIANAKEEQNLLLKLAMKYYLLNLGNCDQNNNKIFRVISLFLENRLNPAITETINKYFPTIPTYKYITILPQIVPHLSNSNDDLFVKQINEVICKCVHDHPHHTLPLILSLVYSNKDRDFSDSTTTTSTNDNRIQSACDLIKTVKQSNKNLNDIITKMECLSEALIQFAYYKSPSKDKQSKFTIPASLKLSKIKNYTNVLLPTYNLEVSKSCSYDNYVGIHSFGDTYASVGGVNAPKRITCRGTDGKVRTQLVKGQDDLRQDAVMQQVFTIMNSLLFANKTTKNLRIRTYKIVPLSMRSGILEWVENSIPIGAYLVGDNEGNVGAHELYRPKDKRPKECRAMFSRADKSSADEKLKVYNNICENIKPVFHKFFEYSFPQPSVWYERQRAYIYSVATSSMCGYILGIGDRHVQNILVDKTTAEVIHIDFGIAFEQGRCLPTPETVPFRLSRDIIDGMGVCGVDGIFRRSCERTMEVMRQNSQTILTIVEVLLYDPLYTWAVTVAEANRRQKQAHDDSSSEMDSTATADNMSINITADRALMRLKSKLHGTEDGYPVSLEHQVGTLIQQAQDPANLCRLFNGWQPYL